MSRDQPGDQPAVAGRHRGGSAAPRLQVEVEVRGAAEPEEVAAVVSVVSLLGSARAAGGAASGVPDPAARSLWADPAHGVRRPRHATLPAPGAGAWRASGLPG